jgi:hypothetical protein
MTVVTAVDVLPRRVAGWAARRSLAPNALTGIGLACSVCAAAWFSAGTRLDALAGGLAVGVGYLARRVRAQLVEAYDAGHTVDAGHPDDARDGVALAAATWPRLAGFEGWLASTGAVLGELAVYAGLAAGARAAQRHGIWLLATEAAITLSIRQVAQVCQPGRGQPGRGQHARAAALAPRSSRSLLAGRLLALPAGMRVVAIAVTAPLWGARITFLALIIWGAAAAAWEIAQSAWTSSRTGTGAGGGIAACRDDGAVARLAGRIVQGQLVPLPPALAGLAATALLAALGLGNLTGLLAFAPVFAMLLAAPGASHPHDGRLDWLVPLILQAAQYIYLTALGFSAGVPGPVTFVLISVVALRQLDVAYRARQQAWAGTAGAGAAGAGTAGSAAQRSALGWDGRILVVGLAALLGFVTFAYLVLTAYLGFLLCRAALSGWLAVSEAHISEGDRR